MINSIKKIRVDRYLITLLVLSAVVKSYVIFFGHNPNNFIYSDMKGYIDRALGLFSGTTGPIDTLFPPGYHFFLSLVMAINKTPFFLAASNFFLAIVTVFLVYKLGLLMANKKVAFIAALMSNFFHKLNVIYGYFISENLYIPLLLTAFYFFLKFLKEKHSEYFLVSSLFFGFSAITRGEGLVVYIIVLSLYISHYVMSFRSRRESGEKSFPLLLGVMIFVVIVGVESFYYTSLAKKPTVIANSSGSAAAHGWCKLFSITSHNPPGSTYYFFATPGLEYGFIEQFETEKAMIDTQFFWGKVKDCIIREPSKLITKLEAIGHLFRSKFFPAYETYGVWKTMSDFFLVLVLILTLFRARKMKKIGLYLLLPFLAALLLAYLIQGEERYLIPSIPFILILFADFYKEEIDKIFG